MENLWDTKETTASFNYQTCERIISFLELVNHRENRVVGRRREISLEIRTNEKYRSLMFTQDTFTVVKYLPQLNWQPW